MGAPKKDGVTGKVLSALAKRMFPPEPDGKAANDELRKIADGDDKQQSGGGR